MLPTCLPACLFVPTRVARTRYRDRVRSRPSITPTIMAVVVAGVAATLLAGCGASEPVGVGTTLAGRLLPGDRLPKSFTAVPYQTGDMIAANRSTLEQATKVGFEPEQCRPTADAAFTPHLTEDNTVLLAAQADGGTLTELVSTVPRNVDADRRDTSGPCRVVTSTPTTGVLVGARIVNTATELPAPYDDSLRESVEQSYLLRTDSVTTSADGSVRSRSTYLANVLVNAPAGTLTVQVGVASNDAVGSNDEPGTARSEPPITEEAFAGLVRSAVERVSRR